jgi:methylated-DNA-protein-cysteine methyltransferase-like protein
LILVTVELPWVRLASCLAAESNGISTAVQDQRAPSMKSIRAGVPPEHAAIRRVIASIPPGRVSSYGEIAARAGLPGRARLVGRVLGEAGAEAALPWQRVLRSDGRIAFPAGSRAFREQVRRLAAEGVLVRNGRVDLTLHGWDRDIDDLLWGPPRKVRARMRQPA